jgi:radical SAM protein with 4Fe4S-binding SPASM domain
MNELYLLAINLTARCNLRCAHCYLDAKASHRAADDELTTREIEQLLAQIAARSPHTLVVLTGGEPLLRRDLESIIAFGASRDLAMVVGTNGTLLSERRVRSLERAGTFGIGISLDSLDPRRHDRFRGLAGSWQKTMRGIDACARRGLSFQLHFSVTDDNAHELAAMIDFAQAAGARVLNVFFLVCTGRGQSLSNISPQRYEEVLNDLIGAQAHHPRLIIRARCAPHFKRVAHQRNPEAPLNRISGSEGDGCIAATHYCRVTPQGGVTACPYIPVEEGNIRRQRFWDIWEHGDGFKRLRDPLLGGKCGVCEYRYLCGGCRARALAHSGSLMDSDPLCPYAIGQRAPLLPLPDSEALGVGWSAEAMQRLERVPPFLQNLVKRRAEAFVAGRGEQLVTTEHLSLLMAQRFGDSLPARCPTVKERVS